MKPALFSVLCEIKEKTGEFYYLLSLLSLLLIDLVSCKEENNVDKYCFTNKPQRLLLLLLSQVVLNNTRKSGSILVITNISN